MPNEKLKRGTYFGHEEFVLRLPMATCIERLGEFDKYGWKDTNTKIHCVSPDQTYYKFSIDQKHVNLHGHLTTQADGSTLVVYEGKLNFMVNVRFVVVAAIILLGFCFVALSGHNNWRGLALLGLVMAFWVLVQLPFYRRRDQLIQGLYEILGLFGS